MTAQLSIWLFVAVIVHVTESVKVCCPENTLISPNVTCENGKKLDFICNDGDSWFLDRNLPDQQFTIDPVTEYLTYKDVELEPARYAIMLKYSESL